MLGSSEFNFKIKLSIQPKGGVSETVAGWQQDGSANTHPLTGGCPMHARQPDRRRQQGTYFCFLPRWPQADCSR